MAGTSLLLLIDDISMLLDDVAAMSKLAAKKTAGILGDDLALNAQQVTGVRAERELPVVWAVAKGSVLNKVILVPAALAISAFAPAAIGPLLMVGGAFLCYEGFEKIVHSLSHGKGDEAARKATLEAAVSNPAVDLVAFERNKIKGAVRTDFILSAEIVAITLGTVTDEPLLEQLLVLSGVALLVTVGVYGLVAAIVKMDDVGLHLHERGGPVAGPVGRGLLAAAPWMMKTLSVVGTAAMFLVGGGIVLHGLPGIGNMEHEAAHTAGAVPVLGGLLEAVTPTLLNGVGGVIVGAIVLAVVTVGQRLWRAMKPV